jgi:hypothetical protein
MPGFVPAVIVPEPRTGATSKTASSSGKPGDDRIDIVLARGRRLIVGTGVDPLPWRASLMSWSGDDPDPGGRAGLAGDRAHGSAKVCEPWTP